MTTIRVQHREHDRSILLVAIGGGRVPAWVGDTKDIGVARAVAVVQSLSAAGYGLEIEGRGYVCDRLREATP